MAVETGLQDAQTENDDGPIHNGWVNPGLASRDAVGGGQVFQGVKGEQERGRGQQKDKDTSEGRNKGVGPVHQILQMKSVVGRRNRVGKG